MIDSFLQKLDNLNPLTLMVLVLFFYSFIVTGFLISYLKENHFLRKLLKQKNNL